MPCYRGVVLDRYCLTVGREPSYKYHSISGIFSVVLVVIDARWLSISWWFPPLPSTVGRVNGVLAFQSISVSGRGLLKAASHHSGPLHGRASNLFIALAICLPSRFHAPIGNTPRFGHPRSTDCVHDGAGGDLHSKSPSKSHKAPDERDEQDGAVAVSGADGGTGGSSSSFEALLIQWRLQSRSQGLESSAL